MRITRDLLMKATRDTVTQLVRQNRRLVCIYLTGSLLGEEYMLGGSADIDLVAVHDGQPPVDRETIPLTGEIHFDIAHLSQQVFHQPRSLRTDPWIAPYLYLNPICLHDAQHWFEFTQAAVCSQYNRPEYVMQRARPLAEEARRLWFSLSSASSEPARLSAYFKVLERAANAVSLLSGPPLTERRFLIHFPQKAQAVERPGLAGGLVDLFMPKDPTLEEWKSWYLAWEEALNLASESPNCPIRLGAVRKPYYLRAANAMIENDPDAALWIMMRTWSTAAGLLPQDSSPVKALKDTCRDLELDEDHFQTRIDSLDAYLDTVEETLDLWAQEYGI